MVRDVQGTGFAVRFCRLLVAAVVIAVSLLVPVATFGEPPTDWKSFAAGSASSQDDMLLRLLDDRDLETELAICAGIVERPGHDVGGYIQGLMDRHFGAGSVRAELLLRVTLAALFPHDLPPTDVDARIVTNRVAMESLSRRIAEWRDPQLLSVLVRLGTRMDRGIALPALMVVAGRIVGALRDGAGDMTPQMVSLGLAWCEAAQAAASPDFLDPCVRIASLSTDAALVAAARGAARRLAVR